MLEIGVDWVALSFVQRPEDIVEIKRLIMEYNPSNAFPPHVMAKIEKPSCFVGNSLEEIVRLSDGISEFTVARPTTRAVFCFVVPPPFAMSRSFSNNTTRPCGASSSSSPSTTTLHPPTHSGRARRFGRRMRPGGRADPPEEYHRLLQESGQAGGGGDADA
jgi:hypothetical protein